MAEDFDNQLSPNKQALLKIRELKRQIAELQSQQIGDPDPIAIVSMACRFPRRSRTPEEFWQCLIDRTDEVSEIPRDRWDLEAFYDEDPEAPGRMYARHGVFLDSLDLMDPEFFGISPREATWVDPQQRLLLEVGWEALERAGWPPKKIGEHTGIFVGWMHNDYQNEASDSFLNLNPYIATGAAGSFLCGRLAYYLGLEGPSVAVDTACSSSLVALHLACHSLQRRDCDRALVGGVNAICSPTTNILTCKLKALSPNGHSRAFDAAADGYLRGEGCGVVTLRRLSDAQRDGDPILGVIRGSAIGHNGFSSGLTAPNPKAQEKVIRQALQRAKIDPSDVDYLEAHGTGTELGDPIEMKAAVAALVPGRGSDNPLLVGSVKTNIGHLEAAAGMAGLIKVLLAMQYNQIPGQLNFDNPNPHIPWEKTPVKVLTDATDWPKSDRRFAGVSAFGMSGTNAHVVIEAGSPVAGHRASPRRSPERTSASSGNSNSSKPSELIVLSGQSHDAVAQIAEKYARHLAGDPSVSLADVAFTTGACRTHFEHRAALVVRENAQAVDALKSLARGGQSETLFQGIGRRPPMMVWQFTGQGSQYVGMARGLYETEPVFRDAIDHCEERLRGRRKESLTDVLFHQEDLINDTRWTQPGIFAVQMGLVKLLESRGLLPDAVLGHSVGQYAAACVAGIMSWDDGLHLISERGRLIGDLPAGGRMLAVFAPVAEVERDLASNPEVSLAAINGTHVVVSGLATAIGAIESRFSDRGIRCKALTTSHAFHSSLMDPVLEPFRKIADEITFEKARLPLICNVTGQALGADERLDGEYWATHIRQPVRFSASIEAAEATGCDTILEIGPQSVLTRMAAAIWRQSANRLISCLQKEVNDAESWLRALGQLYVHGAPLDFDAMYASKNRNRVILPTYPFQRRRFWGPDKPRAFHAEFHTAHPLLGGKVSLAGVTDETRFESFIETDSPPWLPDHEVMGHVVLPGAAYVEMALAAAGSKQVEDIVFELPLRPTSRTALQTIVRADGDDRQTIETFSAAVGNSTWNRNFSAKLTIARPDRPSSIDLKAVQATCGEVVAPSDFYAKMAEIGLNYGPKFQTIDSLQYSSTEVLAHLKSNGDIRGFTIPPTLLDGALHSLAVGLLHGDGDALFLPVGIGRVQCFGPIEDGIWCFARWNEKDGDIRTADLTLFTEDGRVAAQIDGLKVQKISRNALRQISGTGAERLLYELKWQPFRLPAAANGSKKWLIIDCGETTQMSARLRQELADKNHSIVSLGLNTGSAFTRHAEDTFTINGELPEHWEQLFAELSSPETPYAPEGIAWLFGGDQDASSVQSAAMLSAETRANCAGLLNLIQALHHRGIRRIECGLQLITTDAVAVDSGAECMAHQTKYWGLGRVIGAEHPEFRCRLIDLTTADQNIDETANAVVDILLTETRDNQLVVRDSQFFVPRMTQVAVDTRKRNKISTNPDACYLITGGLGMLGRQAAKWLSDSGAKQLVLVSRRLPDEPTQALLDEIEQAGCQVIVHSADVASQSQVSEMFQRFGADWKPLAGVIHTAGILDDALMDEQNWDRFEKVLLPKVVGAGLLHEFTKSLSLDFFIMYSSAASVLGSPGQSNYATANAFLDGLAWQRRKMGLPAISINWGPWTEGMADDQRIIKRLALQGIVPLGVADAHEAMEQMLSANLTQATVMDVDWRRMRMGLGGETPAMLEYLAPARSKTQVDDSELVNKLRKLRGNARHALLVETIQESLRGILSTTEAPETDRPLIEMGLDSLMAVEFSTELQIMLGEQFSIGPTMLFEHPTIDAIAEHLLDLVASDPDDSTTEAAKTPEIEAKTELRDREPIAIIGLSCRFPGARNVDEFWDNLLNGVDSVGEIPSDRWDIDRFFSSERQPGKMVTREGGFLDGIGDFDAAFFNISDTEACWVDPQHRMLLENSYLALEDAGISPHPLEDSNVGVFMGIMGQDYAFLPQLDDQEIIEAFQGAGLSHSAGVGRISYVFGFEGPSIAVDTASSSSLVALDQAVRSLRDGNCNMALAGGVNAILAPVNSLLMSKAGLLSPDGRCKSFSAAANGFGRGEGCGVVVLKRLSDAQRDGDRIMAVVRGGAVVHNGFSGGITSPSGKSQARVISQALADAKIAPSQVEYLEAHGTGTEFGDPMELGAAASIYGQGRKADEPLLVGSAKANIGHLEAAGGISGLIKTVLSLYRGVIPPQIHFEAPSPHVPWDRLPIQIVTQRTEWPANHERFAGVTALGLVGTNAHVVLSSAPSEAVAAASSHNESDEATSTPERSAHLLVLSARNENALSDLAEAYVRFIGTSADLDVGDVCYTAAVGRRHYEHRVAMTFESQDELAKNLAAFGKGLNRGRNSEMSGSTAAIALPTAEPLAAKGTARNSPKVAWLFTGERAHVLDVARELHAVEPVFRDLIAEFDERLREHYSESAETSFRLGDWLTTKVGDNGHSHSATDVHLFALQSGLARLWQTWGIEADVAMGFGVGQYAAACTAGVLCFKDALMLVARRETALAEARLLNTVRTDGAVNTSDLDSQQMAVLDRFEAFADTINYYPPNLQLVCSLSGQVVPVHRSLGGSYWRRHLTDRPLTMESLATLFEMENDFILEIGPNGWLNKKVADISKKSSAIYLPPKVANRSVTSTMLNTLGKLYVGGSNPDFQSLHKHWTRRRLSLPHYPFQKKRYWITEVSDHTESTSLVTR